MSPNRLDYAPPARPKWRDPLVVLWMAVWVLVGLMMLALLTGLVWATIHVSYHNAPGY